MRAAPIGYLYQHDPEKLREVAHATGIFFQAGSPWFEAGPKSAGNGALMRIAPMVIPHLRTATSDLWVDTALSAMITHNDSGSIAACLSFINMLWHLLKIDIIPEPYWWLESYVKVARDLELNDMSSALCHLPSVICPPSSALFP